MAKFTIFLPDDLLAGIDEYAQAIGESRSGVIREASARYLAEGRSAKAAARRKEAVEESIATFEELAKLPSLDGRSSLEILREIRGPLDTKKT